MNYKDKIRDAQQKVYEKIVATKILDLMDKLRMSNNENVRKRWIWELLQNAKDVKIEDLGGVKVKINLDPEKQILYFDHNGSCFSSENITFLIEQTSTKSRSEENEEETTGKFGTGFLTTHLLSEVVDIQGVAADDGLTPRQFLITLDRSSTEIDGIIQSVKKSLSELDRLDSLPDYTEYKPGNFNTTFKYYLNADGIKTAYAGLEDLQSNLPFTLAFLPSILSVSLDREDISYEISSSQIIDLIEITQGDRTIKVEDILVQEAKDKDKNLSIHHLIKIQQDRVDLAISIREINGQKIICEVPQNVSRLYCDFPLVGSEQLGLPFVVNSSYFNPTEPRDGIFLTDKFNPKIDKNKRLIQQAVLTYINFVKYASEQDWGRLDLLAKISSPPKFDWISEKWYLQDVIRPIQECIYSTPLVRVLNPPDGYSRNSKISLKGEDYIVDIPFDKNPKVRQEIWKLSQFFEHFIVPVQKEYEYWYDVIKDKVWDSSCHLTVKILSETVSQAQNLEGLDNLLIDYDPINWLNQYYNLVQLSEKNVFEYWNTHEYRVIPNQCGDFCLPDELKHDREIEEVFKDIAKNLVKDYREVLADRRVSLSQNLKHQTQIDIIQQINKKLESSGVSNELKIEASYILASLFPQESHVDLSDRNFFYDFLSLLFEEHIPKKSHLANWDDKIWSVSTSVLTQHLSEYIYNFQSLTKLSEELGKETNEVKQWLSKFTDFLVKHGFKRLLDSQYPVLLNQNGTFCKLENLFGEEEAIDEILKNIAASLRRDFRDELIDLCFKIEIPKTRLLSQKKVASEICEVVRSRLAEMPRSDATQTIFNEIILWMDFNAEIADEVFGDLYENRHKLYDDVEVARNLRQVKELKQENQSLKEKNQTLEDENLKLKQELERFKSLGLESAGEIETEISPPRCQEIDEEFFIAYGVTTEQKLRDILQDPGVKTQYVWSSTSLEDVLARLEYVLKIIARAKRNVRTYLESLPEYDCCNWSEVGETLIQGVKHNDRVIDIIVRPSDGQRIIFYYPEEKQTLEKPNAELWVEDGSCLPYQFTLGMVLKFKNINRIDLR